MGGDWAEEGMRWGTCWGVGPGPFDPLLVPNRPEPCVWASWGVARGTGGETHLWPFRPPFDPKGGVQGSGGRMEPRKGPRQPRNGLGMRV